MKSKDAKETSELQKKIKSLSQIDMMWMDNWDHDMIRIDFCLKDLYFEANLI